MSYDEKTEKVNDYKGNDYFNASVGAFKGPSNR